VDDCIVICKLIKHLLADEDNIDLHICSSLEDLIHKIKNNTYNVAFIDFHFGNKISLDELDKFKIKPIQVMCIVTGDTNLSYKNISIKWFNHTLLKPVDIAEIKNIINSS